MMDLNGTKSGGDMFIEKNIPDVTKTFQRSDSSASGDVSENGNAVNSTEKVLNNKKSEQTSMSGMSGVTNGQVDEKLRRAIDIVVGYSRVSSETKERLKSAVTDVHCKLMSEQEACQCYQLAVSYFRTYYNMVEKLLNRANLITKEHNRSIISPTEESGIETDVKNEGTEVSSQASNDESNLTDDNKTNNENKTRKVRRTQKDFTRSISTIDKKRIDKYIHDYCGTSLRHSTKRDAIQKAVTMVLHEGCTGVDAAKATNLTPRTVMKHAYIVRDALDLPKSGKLKQLADQRAIENEVKQEDFLEKVTDNDHQIAKMLINEKFGCVEAKDFSGSALELESKIDKLLREFSCGSDMRKVREAIIKIFLEQKSSEICEAVTELPVTVVNSYVRLLKGFLWTENAMKNAGSAAVTTPRRGRKKLCDDEKQDGAENTELAKSSGSDKSLVGKKKRKCLTLMPRGVFIGKIDVLTLHLENGVEDEEQLIKSVISYLISHQYRRSETAQTNMQICLEHVLLDGLSIAETLKIHDGPNEGILEIYQKRCRDAFTALTVHFPAFITELNSLNEDEKDGSRKKRSRMSNVKLETMKAISTKDVSDNDTILFDTVEKLFISIPERAKSLLHSYIMKLLDVNFPLEKRLVSGLLEIIGEKMAMKYILDDKVLEDCVAYFYEKHSGITAQRCWKAFHPLSVLREVPASRLAILHVIAVLCYIEMISATTSQTLPFGSFAKSSSYETKDSGSGLGRPSGEELSPVPDSTEVEQLSESIPEQMEFLIGEDTEQLSDVSDPEGYSTRSSVAKSGSSSSSSRFLAWLSSIYPLIKNKKLRYLTVVNVILVLINLLMLLFWLALLLHYIVVASRISRIMDDQPLPCIFTYGPWSSCSASCWDGSANYPQMRRFVNKSSIVQARGGDKPECPNDLDSRIDIAPCNTFRCPTNLSQYLFSHCYYKDSLKESSSGCYRIRNVPLDDRLIFMDANLTKECSDQECNSIGTYLF
uniref:Uncharacterized protein n=1 Tax=Setaria digitata TaxID=48799 RepID=A0A915PPC6_9BILA